MSASRRGLRWTRGLDADSMRGAGCRVAVGREAGAGNPVFHVCNLHTRPMAIIAQRMRRECPPMSG